jgi:hypothetical protein
MTYLHILFEGIPYYVILNWNVRQVRRTTLKAVQEMREVE